MADIERLIKLAMNGIDRPALNNLWKKLYRQSLDPKYHKGIIELKDYLNGIFSVAKNKEEKIDIIWSIGICNAYLMGNENYASFVENYKKQTKIK